MLDATERRVRRTLKRLAKQRAALVLQPGNVWVIEHAITDDDEETHADLVTCQMRGWIEVLHGAIPHSGLNKDGSLPKEGFGQSKTVWRLTSAGWSVIHGTHRLALYATTIATISLLISAISFAINLLQK